MTQNDSTDAPQSDSAGAQVGDSMRELAHPEKNVGATGEEQDRQADAVREAAFEADRIRSEPGHPGRQGL